MLTSVSRQKSHRVAQTKPLKLFKQFTYAGQFVIDDETLSSTYPDFDPYCGELHCGNTCCVPLNGTARAAGGEDVRAALSPPPPAAVCRKEGEDVWNSQGVRHDCCPGLEPTLEDRDPSDPFIGTYPQMWVCRPGD